jgi:hypothetical protein
MGIAVLLGGGEEDRYAILHAIVLAKRIGEEIHGIRQESSLPSSVPDCPAMFCPGQTLLLQLAGSAGIVAHCHVLDGNSPQDLRELLHEQRLFCLIVGASNETEGKRAEKRMQTLRRSIAHDRHWSIGSFWALVTGPWSEEAMAKAMDDLPDGYRQLLEKRGTQSQYQGKKRGLIL